MSKLETDNPALLAADAIMNAEPQEAQQAPAPKTDAKRKRAPRGRGATKKPTDKKRIEELEAKVGTQEERISELEEIVADIISPLNVAENREPEEDPGIFLDANYQAGAMAMGKILLPILTALLIERVVTRRAS